MAKVALLIGVSEYGPGLNPLPGAVRIVEAMQQVLQSSEKGGFDQVKQLLNPNPPAMREAIETLFSGCATNDLVLIFFSGHILRDDSGKLYFATSITCKNPRAELLKVSTIPVSFVRDSMSNSLCQRQVVILDSCLSSVSAPELAVKHDATVDIKDQLSGQGRTIFTSFTSPQNSFESEEYDHTVYTRYWVEGIRTGAADLNSDGWISVKELHEYASNNVQIAAPAMTPKFYSAEKGYKILLAKAPIGDPKWKYRKEVENWVKGGEISEAGRYVLDKLAQSLQLTFQDCAAIEADAVKPYQEYQKKLRWYEREFTKAIGKHHPLDTQERETLTNLQQYLGLRDEDVTPLEELIAWKLGNISQVEEDADEVVPANIQTELNSVFSTPNAALLEDTHLSTVLQTNLTPAVNASSSLTSSRTSPPAVSTSPNKLSLILAIGGGLATLALAIAISNRTPIAPSSTPVDEVSSSPTPSPKLSPAATTTEKKEATSSLISPPERKDCAVFVNGNLRSEPASFRNNVVAELREPLSVTGKQTEGGWIEVKLPRNKKAWAHRDIIASPEEMDACLFSKGIKIKKVEDIPPPAPSYPPSSQESGVRSQGL